MCYNVFYAKQILDIQRITNKIIIIIIRFPLWQTCLVIQIEDWTGKIVMSDIVGLTVSRMMDMNVRTKRTRNCVKQLVANV